MKKSPDDIVIGTTRNLIVLDFRLRTEASWLDQADLIASGGKFPTLVALDNNATT